MIETLEKYLASKAKKKTGRITLATAGAIKLLEDKSKWGQRFYYDYPNKGCMCTLGAVMTADNVANGVPGSKPINLSIMGHFNRVAEEAGAYVLNGQGLLTSHFNDTQPYEAVMKELRKVHRYAKKHGL